MKGSFGKILAVLVGLSLLMVVVAVALMLDVAPSSSEDSPIEVSPLETPRHGGGIPPTPTDVVIATPGYSDLAPTVAPMPRGQPMIPTRQPPPLTPGPVPSLPTPDFVITAVATWQGSGSSLRRGEGHEQEFIPLTPLSPP